MSDAEMGEDKHFVFLVAKIPSLGVSKTRLVPGLGEESTLLVAEALLLDSIRNASLLQGNQRCILYFSPSSAVDRARSLLTLARSGLTEDAGSCHWTLLPMPNNTDLGSSSLDKILCHAVSFAVDNGGDTCTFIGSDTPDLPPQEVVLGQLLASEKSNSKPFEGEKESDWRSHRQASCYICPAMDGGYVLLTIPLHLLATKSISCEDLFSSVLWSCCDTLSSQSACLQSAGFKVVIGRTTYRDIDDVEDLHALIEKYPLSSEKNVDVAVMTNKEYAQTQNLERLYSLESQSCSAELYPPVLTLEALCSVTFVARNLQADVH